MKRLILVFLIILSLPTLSSADPTFTTHPEWPADILAGTSASITCEATGDGAVSTVVKQGTSTVHSCASGSCTYTISQVSYFTTVRGPYTCEATDDNGTTISNVATMADIRTEIFFDANVSDGDGTEDSPYQWVDGRLAGAECPTLIPDADMLNIVVRGNQINMTFGPDCHNDKSNYIYHWDASALFARFERNSVNDPKILMGMPWDTSFCEGVVNCPESVVFVPLRGGGGAEGVKVKTGRLKKWFDR